MCGDKFSFHPIEHTHTHTLEELLTFFVNGKNRRRFRGEILLPQPSPKLSLPPDMFFSFSLSLSRFACDSWNIVSKASVHWDKSNKNTDGTVCTTRARALSASLVIQFLRISPLCLM